MTMGMNKHFYLRLAVIAAALLAAPGQASAQNVGETIGEAYDLKSNELLYRETHCVSSDTAAREVIYRNHEGRLLARKLLDYSSGATTPSFVQHNLYSRELIEVALKDDNLTMTVQEIGNPEPKKALSTQTDEKLPVVIDAGFDVFVRDHWETLVAGDKKYFLFPFAERSSLVELRIGPTSCSYDNETDQCFRLDLSNWFLRMLVAPIELGYDVESKRLARYRGLSNIGDENGNGQVVDIQYRYRDLPQRACRIADQPLTDERLRVSLSPDDAES